MAKAARRVRYKSYSGFVVRGHHAAKRADFECCKGSVVCSTIFGIALLESPRMGTVQNYDGTGMSGGILHHVAVYPKSKTQGTLGQLMRAVDMTDDRLLRSKLERLYDHLEEMGITINSRGHFVEWRGDHYRIVPGKRLRRALSGPLGVATLKSYQKVRLFSEVLSDTASFKAQIAFAQAWLEKRWQHDSGMEYMCKSKYAVRYLIFYSSLLVNAPGYARRGHLRASKLGPPQERLVFFEDYFKSKRRRRYLRTKRLLPRLLSA